MKWDNNKLLFPLFRFMYTFLLIKFIITQKKKLQRIYTYIHNFYIYFNFLNTLTILSISNIFWLSCTFLHSIIEIRRYFWKVCKNGFDQHGWSQRGKKKNKKEKKDSWLGEGPGFSIRVSEDETSWRDSLSCENLWQLSYLLQWLPFNASISIVKSRRS